MKYALAMFVALSVPCAAQTVTKQDLDRANHLCMQHRAPPPAMANGLPRMMPPDAIPAFEPGYESCAAIVSAWRALLAGEGAAAEKQMLDDLSKKLPK